MISLLTLGLTLSFCILDLLSVQAFNGTVAPSSARQCNWINIRVSGEDARPPYRALIVPLGPLPLSNAGSRIYEVPFDGPLYYSVDAYVRYPVGTEVLPLVSVVSVCSFEYCCSFLRKWKDYRLASTEI